MDSATLASTGVSVAAPPVVRRRGDLVVFVKRVLNTRGAGFGLAITLLMVALAILADFVAPYSPADQDYDAILSSPNAAHWMGTDNLGRDNLSRIIFGTRVSIQAGVVAVGIATVIGTVLGIAAGYWRGWVDDVLMRLCDALWSFPGIV